MNIKFGDDNFYVNPNIIKMEECFKKLHVKQKKNPNKNINDFPEVETLRKLIESTFNFEKVFFVIEGNAANMNAYTLPFLYNKKHTENALLTKRI